MGLRLWPSNFSPAKKLGLAFVFLIASSFLFLFIASRPLVIEKALHGSFGALIQGIYEAKFPQHKDFEPFLFASGKLENSSGHLAKDFVVSSKGTHGLFLLFKLNERPFVFETPPNLIGTIRIKKNGKTLLEKDLAPIKDPIIYHGVYQGLFISWFSSPAKIPINEPLQCQVTFSFKEDRHEQIYGDEFFLVASPMSDN